MTGVQLRTSTSLLPFQTNQEDEDN
ncbi:hypothetical protein BVI2075_110007 [Burkholderia vietnamiensis]|nr:hypothetical protein BVI2075_110007 [Burkholderia vietnamiensis]